MSLANVLYLAVAVFVLASAGVALCLKRSALVFTELVESLESRSSPPPVDCRIGTARRSLCASRSERAGTRSRVVTKNVVLRSAVDSDDFDCARACGTSTTVLAYRDFCRAIAESERCAGAYAPSDATGSIGTETDDSRLAPDNDVTVRPSGGSAATENRSHDRTKIAWHRQSFAG